MRFQKSESAFFVFMGVTLAAGAVTLHAYHVVGSGIQGLSPALLDASFQYLRKLLFATGVLLVTGVFFGMFFIYPLIRKQVSEHGKLRQMTASLSARSQTLEQAALTDALTGIQNRRYFDDALQEYLEEFGRIEKPVGLMILDLDHFKQINDTHGHHIGDEVLKAVAKCLKDLTRYHDVVARLGGEEFAVVAPNMDRELLIKLAERIRRGIAGLAIMSDNAGLKITTSVGLAVWDRNETADKFFARADGMLYEAKRLGRNRVCS
ncbi:MAG: GGDEF domain-containing protein [Rhizobiaceae bacterium]|nr:GGDEF domain-containing protein [Rhizobiaceae bacterium]